MSGPDELERLAAEGRARKAHEDARAREALETEARERRRASRDVLHGSVSSYARWGWFVAGIPCGALLAFACVAAFPATAFVDREGEAGGVGGLVSLLAFFVGFVVTRALRGFFGARAVERERAWARALPFP
ncbi:MAG TPA: hypothetical protein VGD87_12870, partial [Archangium sp.]